MFRKVSIAIIWPQHAIRDGLKLITSFLVGQAAVQSIQLFSGFLLIRWLSVEDYAHYSMAFAFQSTAHVVVELGFSGAIVALVGNRVDNKKVIGGYIKAGQFYRTRLFFLIATACAILFPVITSQHGWPLVSTVLLLASILVSLYFSGYTSYYTSPLMIHRQLSRIYEVEIKHGLLRFVSLAMLNFSSVLNAWLAAWTTTLVTVANGYAFRRRAADYIEEPATAPSHSRREMLTYLQPVMPGILFSAFQGHLMIFIISAFGEVQNIAEVAALGRLGQIFILLNTAGGALVAPYFARQPKEGLGQKYFYTVFAATFLAFSMWAVSYVFRDLFISIIGSRYEHLVDEVPFLVLSSCLMFINTIMWSIISARKWLWWWMPVLNIGGVLTLQFLGVATLDLSTTHGVILLSLFVSAFTVLHKVIVTIYGFSRG